MTDLSDRPDGPALYAFWGTEAAENEFRLGTREYEWHRHVRGQLFCIESGLVRVRTARGSWLLPPHRAGWIPAGVDHEASVSGALSGWGVMLRPDVLHGLPSEPCVMGVSEMLRALVRRAASWGAEADLQPEQERIVGVLLDEIRLARREALYLPLPVERRLLAMANLLIEHPEDERTFDELAAWAGLSARTARRHFAAQTGMSFVHWRQQARLALALEQLAGGEAVASVADALGYATPSNFIAMFRKAFGESPARYFSKRRDTE
ncbi:MAG: helix-turn-helix transcriptional regulator [Paraburkholderia sp.]|jgi:AraC-like DNA-binding protein|uniref:AraC family transcriptional regulator n=1 Tax=Burkholderiaceae TaxID=119060 RepID=UPI0010F9F32E|nr:helix-turn-helix transcriptional regulator [Burkholderia sp. 4M9327F10]